MPVYAAVLLAAFVAFVHSDAEPTLASRLGRQYKSYRRQVPGRWYASDRGAGGILAHRRMVSSRLPVSDSMRSVVSWLAANAVVPAIRAEPS